MKQKLPAQKASGLFYLINSPSGQPEDFFQLWKVEMNSQKALSCPVALK
jgi:hypothetical protein